LLVDLVESYLNLSTRKFDKYTTHM